MEVPAQMGYHPPGNNLHIEPKNNLWYCNPEGKIHGCGNKEVEVKVTSLIWPLQSLMFCSPKEESFHQAIQQSPIK